MHRSTKEIKKRLIDLELTIEGLAQEFGCRSVELTMCINRHQYRVYPELRRKLCMRLGLNQERLFGSPTARRSYAQPKPMRRAA